MRRALAGMLAVLVVVEPAVLGAQQGTAPSFAPAPQTARPVVVADVDLLGIDLARIRRELAWLEPSDRPSHLKLEYFVEVVAEAPPILLFKPGDLTTGPAPMGAPTHSDIVNHLTPEAFKGPVMPIGAIAIMGIQKLVQWEARKAKERREELERLQKNEAERERQRRIKESIVVTPPKTDADKTEPAKPNVKSPQGPDIK
jgi:hypothetical protein